MISLKYIIRFITFISVTALLLWSSFRREIVNSIDPPLQTEKNNECDSLITYNFGEIDSSKIIPSVLCSHGYFGILSDRYVIHLDESLYKIGNRHLLINGIDVDTTYYNISVNKFDLHENHDLCSIKIYLKNNSRKDSYCSDLIMFDKPYPVKITTPTFGNLSIINGKPKIVYGSNRLTSYIKISNLKFIDHTLSKPIEVTFDTIYIYGIPHLGTPE